MSNKYKWLLLIVVMYLLYLSRARVGFLILLSLLFPIVYKWFYDLKNLRLDFFKSIINLMKITFFLIFIIAFGFLNKYQENFKTLLYKAEENTNLYEAYQDSRGFIMTEQWENFKGNKIFGIGFGISNSITHSQEIDYYNGIPISASTEKANLPLAILEETGVLGFVSFVLLFSFVSKRVGREKYLWIAIILSNFAEVTFFSFGSFGLLAGVIMAKIVALK